MGTISACLGVPEVLTVQAVSEVKVHCINEKEFTRLLESHPTRFQSIVIDAYLSLVEAAEASLTICDGKDAAKEKKLRKDLEAVLRGVRRTFSMAN